MAMYSNAKSLTRRFCETVDAIAEAYGFRELNGNGKWYKRVLWVLIFTVCTSFLIVHVSEQIGGYLGCRTSLTVKNLSPDDPYLFPKIIYGVPKWLWIDLEKLKRYNITKEELTIAKSYLGTGELYNSTVPVDVAKESLNAKMAEMGVLDIRGFFYAFVRNDGVGISFQNVSYGTDVARPGVFLSGTCFYVLNTEKASVDMFSSYYSIVFNFDYSTYLKNLEDHMAYFGPREEASSSIIPFEDDRPYLYGQDTGEWRPLRKGGYYHTVHHTIWNHRRLSSCNKAGTDDKPFHDKKVCDEACDVKANLTFKTQSCYKYWPGTTQLISGKWWPICSEGVYVNGSLVGKEDPVYYPLSAAKREQRDAMAKSCKASCMAPCSQWLVESRFTATESEQYQNACVIRVLYPERKAVMVLEEVESYKWHDLISDIGGLLGLWLGASVLGLCRFVQLCVCPDQKGNSEGQPSKETEDNRKKPITMSSRSPAKRTDT